MGEHPVEEHPRGALFSHASLVAMPIGAPAALVVAAVYGLPAHAVVILAVSVGIAGLGITLGLHRFLTHRAFATHRPVEWGLMVMGCMAGQSSPFFWVATHRKHHRLSDHEGDPHSPHASRGGWLARFWHAYMGWTVAWVPYDPGSIRDLTRRADLVWIDRRWYLWYLLGLALPAGAGYLIGGTAYDALIGFLWGGMLRHAITQHATYMVNSVAHVWGHRAFETGDHSRNSFLLALFTMGDGWHNNHHAQPYSARHGFSWWQVDGTWCVIWLMERAGLAWDVRRPRLPPQHVTEPQPPAVAHPLS